MKSLLAWARTATKSLLAKVGAGLTGLALTGLIGYWIAFLTPNGPRALLPFWVLGGAAALGAVGFLTGQEHKPISPSPQPPAVRSTAVELGDPEQTDEPWAESYSMAAEPQADIAAEPPRDETFTGLWRHTSDGFEA